MFQNMLMTALTPLQNTNEFQQHYCCQNTSFISICPEDKIQRDFNTVRGIQKKRKRTRINFTTEQLAKLESVFKTDKYLNGLSRNQLAESLQLHDRNVKIWFQNRRMREKRNRLQSNSDSSSEVTGSQLSPRLSEHNPFSNETNSMASPPTNTFDSSHDSYAEHFQNNQDNKTFHVSPPLYPITSYENIKQQQNDPSNNQENIPYYNTNPTNFYPTHDYDYYYYTQNHYQYNDITCNNDAQNPEDEFALNYFELN